MSHLQVQGMPIEICPMTEHFAHATQLGHCIRVGYKHHIFKFIINTRNSYLACCTYSEFLLWSEIA